MQRAYTSILDDETIGKLNVLAKVKFGKDRKTSNFLRDMIAMLYDGCIMIAESGNVDVISGKNNQYENIVLQEKGIAHILIGVKLGNKMELTDFAAKYKEKA